MVTLKEIAAKAGVSVMAVSAVMNNTKSTRVSETRRQHIRKIADEMGYRSNVLARTLRGGRSNMIGIVLDSQAPPWLYTVLRFIEEEAGRNGYRILVSEEHNSVEHIIQSYEKFLQYGVDGVITLASDYPGQSEAFYRYFADKKNFVVIGNDFLPNISQIGIDFRAAWREAVAYFLAHGRQRVAAVILDLPIMLLQSRISTYRDVCRELAIESRIYHPDPQIISRDTPASFRAVVEDCFNRFIRPEKIDAMIVHGDLLGTFMLSGVSRLGMKIPDDLALIIDDRRDYFPALQPPAACVDHRESEIGIQAVRLLCALINGEANGAQISITSKLILDESAGSMGAKE